MKKWWKNRKTELLKTQKRESLVTGSDKLLKSTQAVKLFITNVTDKIIMNNKNIHDSDNLPMPNDKSNIEINIYIY